VVTRDLAIRVSLGVALAAAFVCGGGGGIVSRALVDDDVPNVRRAFIDAVVSYDAEPGPDPELVPAPPGARGFAPATMVRVVLIDGAGIPTSRTMPRWDALCRGGLDVVVDVGFPTVSLPVQIALWSGLTQTQTGVLFHSGKPLVRALAEGAIPAQVPHSIAIAESHPYIVQSLGFATAEPPLGKLPDGWDVAWIDRALLAVTSDTRLAFVHILRVDTAGHKFGPSTAAWRDAAASADAILGRLIDAAAPLYPDALWLVLADHDHIAGGGHGGEEREIRQVRACFAGPGVVPRTGGPIHLVDVSVALADALSVRLPPAAKGRPIEAALAHPLDGDDAVPPLPLGRGVIALALIAIGVAITAWGMQRRWLLGPWWLPFAVGLLVIFAGTPTLSTPMIYKPQGRDMYMTYWPALAVLAVQLSFALPRLPPARIIAGLLGLPIAAIAALFTITGGWPIVVGGEAAPVVPRWTGWTSPALLIVAQGCGVVALGMFVSAITRAISSIRRRETRTPPASAA
jgi:hypothetical protein